MSAFGGKADISGRQTCADYVTRRRFATRCDVCSKPGFNADDLQLAKRIETTPRRLCRLTPQ
jgi:hypothetical protein